MMSGQGYRSRDQVPAFDPVPWYLDEDEALRRGLKSGWYIFDYMEQPVVGPCESPEDAVSAVHHLGAGPRLQ
jgi:hypothetical protein